MEFFDQCLLLREIASATVIATTANVSTENKIAVTLPTPKAKTIPKSPPGVPRDVRCTNLAPIKERIARAPQTANTISRISARLCRAIIVCPRQKRSGAVERIHFLSLMTAASHLVWSNKKPAQLLKATPVEATLELIVNSSAEELAVGRLRVRPTVQKSLPIRLWEHPRR